MLSDFLYSLGLLRLCSCRRRADLRRGRSFFQRALRPVNQAARQKDEGQGWFRRVHGRFFRLTFLVIGIVFIARRLDWRNDHNGRDHRRHSRPAREERRRQHLDGRRRRHRRFGWRNPPRFQWGDRIITGQPGRNRTGR